MSRDRALAKKVGASISAARRGRGWTQEELAAALDVTVGHVGMIERGDRLLSLTLLVDCAEILGLSLDEILLSSQDKPRQQGVEVGQLVGAMPEELRTMVVAFLKAGAKVVPKRRKPKR